MNIYSISSLIAFIISFFLVLFIVINGLRDKYRRAIVPLIFCVGIWCSFPFMAALWGAKKAILLARLVYLAAIFSVPFFLNFGLTILNLEKIKREKMLIRIVTLISVSFFLPFLSSSLFIKDVLLFQPQFIIKGGPIYLFFILFFGVVCLYCFYKLYIEYRHSKGYRKNQLKYVFLGFLLAFISGLIHFAQSFNIPEFFPHDLLVVACMLILIYSIIRHRLMDITLVITRAGIFAVVYTVVLGLPFALAFWLRPWVLAILGINWWIAPLGVMASLATVGPFIYIYLDKRAEDRLLKEQKRYQDTLKQASLGMTRIRNLQKLLNLIVHIVSRAVRINYVGVYLLEKDNSAFRLKAARKKRGMQVASVLKAESGLSRRLKENSEPLIFEEMRRQLQDSRVEELEELKGLMDSLGAEVIIPCFIENRLLGFMALGEKRSGKIYTEADLQVFMVLANQAALAIENARFFEESREMQEQIAQAEKMATIGTMADGLSHQINNRFHALSLIAGDTLDSIQLAGVENYTGAPKELFGEIKYAMSRIQDNVMQGSQIVSGMLRYTRKTDTGFAPISLDAVIDAALEMLKYKIKLNDMEIVRDYPKDIPRIQGNLPQLQEVFFNLIDNAYDAMMECRNNRKEESCQPRLRVSAHPQGEGYLRVAIEDNGAGINPDDFKKIFTPFFTTKVSSRRGTGLGLYVIKKIITQNHNGRIGVESEFGRGTRFILDLPVGAG